MVDILLYFGSFNPIHKGHTAIAKYLLDKGYCSELWIVPSPENPFKKGRELIDAATRVEMAKIACANVDKRLIVSDIELEMPRPSYTINTLEKIKSLEPDRTLGLLIGGDNLEGLAKWKDIEKIRQICEFFLYPRLGSECKVSDEKITVLKGVPYFDVSSTMVREKLLRGEDVSEFLDTDVISYIKMQKL
ncbi:MAG: nicotinate (nicotinamide) nucleotide adenylyltransferase [Rikenellaceae bacterium]